MYSYVIATRREDLKELKRLVRSLQRCLSETCEIIAVVDGWKTIFQEELPLAKIVYQRHAGVGAAFDNGVSKAKNDYVVLLGSDVRFNEDPVPVFDKIKEDKTLTCFACKVMGGDKVFYGAGIVEKSGGRIYQAKWRRERTGKHHQIGCILGAAYLVKKLWYEKIEGFKNHKDWGTLEPLISLKSYMMGGSCKVYSDLVIEHEFGRHKNGAAKDPVSMVYNQLHVDSFFKKSREKDLTQLRWLKKKASAMLPEPFRGEVTAETALKKMKQKQK